MKTNTDLSVDNIFYYKGVRLTIPVVSVRSQILKIYKEQEFRLGQVELEYQKDSKLKIKQEQFQEKLNSLLEEKSYFTNTEIVSRIEQEINITEERIFLIKKQREQLDSFMIDEWRRLRESAEEEAIEYIDAIQNVINHNKNIFVYFIVLCLGTIWGHLFIHFL